MSLPNELEQLMLNLINQERTNANLAPLAFSNVLNDASEDHSTWMLDTDTFSHTGQNGSSAGDRVVDAGYALEGDWTWGENIGWQSERGDPGLEDDVRDIHQSLMNSPGHRANILNPDFEDIGIGIEQGDFDNFDSVMVTQNFGATDAVLEDDDDNQTPPPEDPTNEMPDDEEPPVAENPDDDTDDQDPPVTEGPSEDDEEPPVAENPDEEMPDEEPPVAEGPDAEEPDTEDPDAEDPDAENPDDDDTPIAEGPDTDDPDDENPMDDDMDDDPDGEEPPIAEGPDAEEPDDETPDVEDPGDEEFDIEGFFAELGELLGDLLDEFELIASEDCDPEITIDGMPSEDDPMMDDPMTEEPMVDDMSVDDDMEFTCDGYDADAFDFQVSINLSFNFDLG